MGESWRCVGVEQERCFLMLAKERQSCFDREENTNKQKILITVHCSLEIEILCSQRQNCATVLSTTCQT